MNANDKNNYCCCQIFPILNSIFYVSVHCLLHGTYGIYLVTSSYHRFRNYSMNYCAVASSSFFILVGLFIFGTGLKRSWKMAGFGTCLLVFVTLANLVTYTTYFIYYVNFNANSLLDSVLFWRSQNDWVNKGDLPFTLWHGLSFSFVVFNFVGFYYSAVLSRYAKILRGNDDIGNLQNVIPNSSRIFQSRVN